MRPWLCRSDWRRALVAFSPLSVTSTANTRTAGISRISHCRTRHFWAISSSMTGCSCAGLRRPTSMSKSVPRCFVAVATRRPARLIRAMERTACSSISAAMLAVTRAGSRVFRTSVRRALTANPAMKTTLCCSAAIRTRRLRTSSGSGRRTATGSSAISRSRAKQCGAAKMVTTRCPAGPADLRQRATRLVPAGGLSTVSALALRHAR